MTEKRVMKLASRGNRFGAACIDLFVPLVSYLLVSVVLAANGIRTNYPGYGYGFGNEFGYGYGYGYGYGMGNQHLSGASAAIMIVVFFILMAYMVAELILFAKGKTIGKAILGLQVVSSTDGKHFTFWKMFFRECFVKSASGSVFCLGYIWILLDDKNRGWHDKILDSYVVDLKESERMNYRRHLEEARKSASAAPAPEPVQVPETKEIEPVMPEVQVDEEPVIEVTEEPEEKVEVEAEVTIYDSEEDEAEAAAEEAVTEESAEVTIEETAGEITEKITEEAESDNPVLSMSMKKEELLEAARERGVQVSSRATKAAIIEAVEKAAEETEK